MTRKKRAFERALDKLIQELSGKKVGKRNNKLVSTLLGDFLFKHFFNDNRLVHHTIIYLSRNWDKIPNSDELQLLERYLCYFQDNYQLVLERFNENGMNIAQASVESDRFLSLLEDEISIYFSNNDFFQNFAFEFINLGAAPVYFDINKMIETGWPKTKSINYKLNNVSVELNLNSDRIQYISFNNTSDLIGLIFSKSIKKFGNPDKRQCSYCRKVYIGDRRYDSNYCGSESCRQKRSRS